MVDPEVADALLAGGLAINTALSAVREAEQHFEALADIAPGLGFMEQVRSVEAAIRHAGRGVQQLARQVARTERVLASD